jgi:hypothetical protein
MNMAQTMEGAMAEQPKYLEKPHTSVTLPNTNFKWPDLGSNPGRHNGKREPNRLNYGMAFNRLFPR